MGVNVVKLEDVCEFYRGLTYSKKDEATFSNKIVLRASNIDLNTSALDFDDLKYLREDFNIPEDKKLRKYCIFICMSSGSKSHLGKVAFIDKDYDYAFGGFMGMIKPKANILPKYLFYLLQTPEYKELLRKLSNGININNIKFTDLKDFEFELPTIDEQEKILNTLDKADEIRQKKKLANDKLDEFLKSTFISMFGTPYINEKLFPNNTFKNICTVRQGLQIPIGNRKNEPASNRLKYITIQYLNGKKETEYIENPRENVVCTEKDILMTRTGNTGMVITNVNGVFHNNFFLIDFNREILKKEFLVCYLKHPKVQSEIIKKAGTSTIPDLNHSDFYKIELFIPPIEEQNKFAKIVEKVEAQKQKNELVIEQMNNLFNALSQKAFKGDL